MRQLLFVTFILTNFALYYRQHYERLLSTNIRMNNIATPEHWASNGIIT